MPVRLGTVVRAKRSVVPFVGGRFATVIWVKGDEVCVQSNGKQTVWDKHTLNKYFVMQRF